MLLFLSSFFVDNKQNTFSKIFTNRYIYILIFICLYICIVNKKYTDLYIINYINKTSPNTYVIEHLFYFEWDNNTENDINDNINNN